MNKLSLATIALLAFAPSTATAANTKSFIDCKYATSPTAVTICKDKTLMKIDEVASALMILTSSRLHGEARMRFELQDLGAYSRLEKCGNDVDCIRKHYAHDIMHNCDVLAKAVGVEVCATPGPTKKMCEAWEHPVEDCEEYEAIWTYLTELGDLRTQDEIDQDARDYVPMQDLEKKEGGKP